MTYPRIFSLSTVGILKHYVHDYLFHPLRTDFIGPNGVGKSIIADLLQLMFVYDSSLIRFGTDGVKKDERTIYNLPYNLATAYSFLNVEVEPDQFVIIGIAINSQIGGRITPFIITRSAELEKNIDELSLLSNQRLKARDFLENNQVPDIKSLANRMLTEFQLFLTYFRTKEDAKRYYQFLYDKHILAINLSVDEHLSAFAKVIQSFSKAKSLDLSPSKASKSLKQFLFEDADTDLEAEYRLQQNQLEKLLRDFSSLEVYIKGLRAKQKGLLELKKLDEHQQNLLKAFKIAEIVVAKTLVDETKLSTDNLINQIEGGKQDKSHLEELLAEFPEKISALKEQLDASNDYTQVYNAYKVALQNQELLREEVTSLKMLTPPQLPLSWVNLEGSEDVSILDSNTVKRLITESSQYLKKFTSPDELERAFDKQKDNIAQLTQSIKSRMKELDKLAEIVSTFDDASVIGWGLKNKAALSEEQKATLLHFGTKEIIAPQNPVPGDNYVDPDRLIQSVQKSNDNCGFWLNLGPLHEYLPLRNDKATLLNGINGSETIDEMVKTLKEEQDQLSQQLSELDSVNRGKVYNKEVLKEDYDLSLINYENVKNVKLAARCIVGLEQRILNLETLCTSKQNAIAELRAKLPTNIVYDEPDVIERDLRRLAEQALKQYATCSKDEANVGNNLKNVNTLLEQNNQKLIDVTKQLLDLEDKLFSLKSNYYTFYKENIDESTIQPITESTNINKLEVDFQDATQEYKGKYRDLMSQFPETNSGKHAAVNRAVSEKTYDFAVLESALLGDKIKYTDEISQALEDANRNRMNMADNIKNTMVLIFNRTVQTYKQYKTIVYTLNQFFQGVKISNRFFFSINFTKNETVRIEILEEIGSQVRNAAKRGELPFDKPVGGFIEEFFRKTAQLKEKVTIDKLLDPKTFFNLSVSLTDELGKEIPGSTGETYSAIALLGIARLSLVQKEKRRGLRFIILEELGSLDTVNFNTFPAIAKEFAYQIITMAPTPFRSSLDDEWYAHHLIKGNSNPNINYHPSASYFKTKNGSQELEQYLKLANNDLD